MCKNHEISVYLTSCFRPGLPQLNAMRYATQLNKNVVITPSPVEDKNFSGSLVFRLQNLMTSQKNNCIYFICICRRLQFVCDIWFGRQKCKFSHARPLWPFPDYCVVPTHWRCRNLLTGKLPATTRQYMWSILPWMVKRNPPHDCWRCGYKGSVLQLWFTVLLLSHVN